MEQESVERRREGLANEDVTKHVQRRDKKKSKGRLHHKKERKSRRRVEAREEQNTAYTVVHQSIWCRSKRQEAKLEKQEQ